MGRKNRDNSEQVSGGDFEKEVPAAEEIIDVITPQIIEEHKVDFDGWYGARMSRIPTHHYKEILKADFKARKVPIMATMAAFDEALRKYGVKLT